MFSSNVSTRIKVVSAGVVFGVCVLVQLMRWRQCAMCPMERCPLPSRTPADLPSHDPAAMTSRSQAQCPRQLHDVHDEASAMLCFICVLFMRRVPDDVFLQPPFGPNNAGFNRDETYKAFGLIKHKGKKGKNLIAPFYFPSSHDVGE